MQKLLTKYIVVLLLVGLLFSFAADVNAQVPQQSVSEEKSNPVETIVEESEGNVEIEIPDDILEEILTPPQQTAPQKGGQRQTQPSYRKGVNRVNGFRIMVFSDGRNPSTLQSRARARGNAIAAKFPKYRGQVYAYSKSPNWYCTVGNFKTQADATRALGELRRAFPSFASEMRVVKSQITIK